MTNDDDDTPQALNPKQQRFVEEYLVDFSATAACTRAGYSVRDPAHAGMRLMKIPAIRAAIADGRRQLAETCRIRSEQVIAGYARIAFASLRDYVEVLPDGGLRFDFSRVPPEAWCVIEEIRIDDYKWPSKSLTGTRMRLRLASRLHALDSLSRCLGLITDSDQRDLAKELREARARLRSRAANGDRHG